MTIQQQPPGGWRYSQRVNVCSPFSLVFVVDPGQEKVLLGMKKRGFGVDLYNGFGGKPGEGEDMMDCARRELEEECGLQVERDWLLDMGRIIIARPSRLEGEPRAVQIHIFACTQWTGTPTETEEMRPVWFSFSGCAGTQLPWGEMWPEARLYLPPLLSSISGSPRRKLEGYIEYHLVSDQPFETWRRLKTSNSEAISEVLAGWTLDFRQK